MQSRWQRNYLDLNNSIESPDVEETVTKMNAESWQSPIVVEENWRVGTFGSGIGNSGIITADIDNDGTIEIISAGSISTFGAGNFWYILEYSSTSQEYIAILFDL